MSRDTLQEREGEIFVLGSYTMSDKPERHLLWWPTGARAASFRSNYGEDLIGKPLRDLREGRFEIEGTHIVVHLTDGGRTKARWVDVEQIPPPKTRVEVRWHNGRWEKYLKSKGWVPA